MSYYLYLEGGGRPKPLVHDGVSWSWGTGAHDRLYVQASHFREPYQIMEAESAAETGYEPSEVYMNCGRGVLDEDGNFFGCLNGGHGILLNELMDYHGVDSDYAKDNWVCVYEDQVMELYDSSNFSRRVEQEGYRLNDAQNAMLGRLGFDTDTYRRKQVPEYDDVFSDDRPAYPPRECTARIVEDVQEVKDWMKQQEATFTDAPGL